MLENNLVSTIVTFVVALLWLRLNNLAVDRGWISSQISRKIIHIGTGPLFVLCWLLFKPDPLSRYFAALVPFAITVQFVLVGLGIIRDPAAVQAMSRTGDRREILRGPLFYGIVFVVSTVVFWYDTPTGIVALMMMCGGDGLAEILGRRFGRSHLPWNKGKSWFGSLGMFLGGLVFSVGIVYIFIHLGAIQLRFGEILPGIALIGLAGTVVESLPLEDVDNITVTLTAAIIGSLLF